MHGRGRGRRRERIHRRKRGRGRRRGGRICRMRVRKIRCRQGWALTPAFHHAIVMGWTLRSNFSHARVSGQRSEDMLGCAGRAMAIIIWWLWCWLCRSWGVRERIRDRIMQWSPRRRVDLQGGNSMLLEGNRNNWLQIMIIRIRVCDSNEDIL